MRKLSIIIGLVFLTFVLALIINKYSSLKNEGSQVKGSQIKYSQIKIKNKKIKAEVADNLELRLKGISGRKSLCSNCGMIFVFERADIYPFWMKEMKFPLDIIWIKDKRIVEISASAPTPEAAGQIMNYTPKAEADLVLEVNAGFCQKNGVKIEDGIEIK